MLVLAPKWCLACGGQIRILGTQLLDLAIAKCSNILQDSIFIVLMKILFAAHSKHSSFLASSNVKPMPNDLVHVLVCSLCKV
jgi:hypothetical protein